MSTRPPGQPPGAPTGKNRSVMWGWLGIVIGLFCCGVLGLIFGALSLRDAGKYRTDRTLGYVAIAASLVNIVFGGVLTATGNLPW